MTNSADRDAAIDRLLRSGRRYPPAAPDGVCLDAETLAAWAEDTLSDAERAAAEGHAAGCARCQALLAAMVRTEPESRVLAQRWRRGAFFRWAVPLTAAAAAVALWIAVDPDVGPRFGAERAVPAPAAPPPDAMRPAPPPVPPTGQRATTDRGRAPARTQRDAEAVPRARDHEIRQQARGGLLGGPPPARMDAPAAGTAADLSRETEAPPVASAAAESAVERRFVGPRAGEPVFRTEPSDVAWTEVPSPDPLVRWRFRSSGEVERSIDGGVTWMPAVPAGNGTLITASAPSSSVCWLAGRAGAVLRFTTAGGWQRLTVPDAPDIVAIQARSADAATVTLADGRRLSTVDGGATWQ